MKRLHVNLLVKNVEETVGFYNALFGTEPTVEKPDYAKWLLDDPSVNFSISLSKDKQGVNHLGIQAESEEELQEIYANITKADAVMEEEGHTVCCYAKSEKSWVKDPQGVEWEAFYTYGESEVNKITTPASRECCEDTCCTE